jgi:hypothetical protein
MGRLLGKQEPMLAIFERWPAFEYHRYQLRAIFNLHFSENAT